VIQPARLGDVACTELPLLHAGPGRRLRQPPSRWAETWSAGAFGQVRAPGGDAELTGLYFADAGSTRSTLFVDTTCRAAAAGLLQGALAGRRTPTGLDRRRADQARGDRTHTYEYNRNLVLTDGTRVTRCRNLEILTGEIVGAGHASPAAGSRPSLFY